MYSYFASVEPCVCSQGGPTACGWVPNAKDASSSALDDNWPRDVGLHPNDETSCRYATRPEKGRATLRCLEQSAPAWIIHRVGGVRRNSVKVGFTSLSLESTECQFRGWPRQSLLDCLGASAKEVSLSWPMISEPPASSGIATRDKMLHLRMRSGTQLSSFVES